MSDNADDDERVPLIAALVTFAVCGILWFMWGMIKELCR